MQIPHYLFDSVLYRGDATVVYAGVRERDGLPVVGKMVSGGLRDLRSELALLQKLQGPGVVQPLGLFDSNEGAVLVQCRFGNGSLEQVVQGGKLPVATVLSIARQLSEVLLRMSSASVLHRDLKPANVLYDSASGLIALADFGIAVELPPHTRSLPVADLVGTPAYLSPEQSGRTRSGCDVRSDLYALGVTLYQLLTGSLPFTMTDLGELLAAHLSVVPESPAEREPSVPRVLSDLVMKLLAKSPEQRYQSARGLRADLVRCLDTLSTAGAIEPFELGRSDLVRLRAVTPLFGREPERARLRAAFAEAATGLPTLALISGPEGSGRNELMRSALKSDAVGAACAQAAFVAGSARPLGGIGDALTALARDLLLLEDRQLAALRERLQEALGQVGQVLIDIAPALQDVLGPQPALTPLGPAEARARLQHVWQRFTGCLGAEHVFVLALSDFQHADLPSQQLLQSLLSSTESLRVMVVLTAREAADFGALRERAGAVQLELGPLSLEAVVAWTASLLGCPPAHVRPLAAVLHEKSAGNPGLYRSLLEHLVEQGSIARNDGVWGWSLSQVRAEKPPQSLGAMVAQRVTELTPEHKAVLAASVVGEAECDLQALCAMVQDEPVAVAARVSALERQGLLSVAAQGGHAVTHAAIAESVLASTPEASLRALHTRLALHLLHTLDAPTLSASAFRVAHALLHGTNELPEADRARATELLALSAERATGLMSYATAAQLFERGSQLLGKDPTAQALSFQLEVGLARSTMMLGQHERAEQLLLACCERELTSAQIAIAYVARVDNCSALGNRMRGIDIGLEGLARLGVEIAKDVAPGPGIQLLIANEQKLKTMSVDDHVTLRPCTDEHALAVIRVLSVLSGPVGLLGLNGLYLAILERGLALQLEHGYTRFYASFLSTHSMILHSRVDNFPAAKASYEACLAVQRARPAPEIDGRTYLVLHYMICPWIAPWHESLQPLEQGIQLAIEAGDPLFAALSASASLTLLFMSGAPLDRVVQTIENFSSVMRADAGVTANATNVHNLAGKLSRGEPVEQSDLDRVTGVSLSAGSTRNNAMVNLGLALSVVGHEAQVRLWLDEVRVTFPKVNAAQPHLVTLWLLEGIFAAKDAENGKPERLQDAARFADNLRALQTKSQTDNHSPAIALLEAEIARAKAEVELASGLYGRAVSEAKKRGLTPLVAYAMERRAQMLESAGQSDEAALFYRESAIAYRRWSHMTKVRELELSRPELKTLELSRSATGASDTRRNRTKGPRVGASQGTHQVTHHGTINEALDLATVLEVAQQISTELHGSGVVRAVLRGIAQSAGAERVSLILRESDGREVVCGTLEAGEYHELGVALTDYAELPHSALRLVRRTARPLIVADAVSCQSHGSDPFVISTGCRSLAVVPVVRKGEFAGFVVLENRLTAGAFTPQLVSLTQALVAQAAISLDNASLYENMEQRVQERTFALHAKHAELKLVFDTVAEGLIMVDRAGRVSSEGSAILGSWFPEGLPETLHGLFAHDSLFGMSWEQLTDGFLPPELCIDQLPQQLPRGAQTLALSWRPIVGADGEMIKMLLVMSDITEALRQKSAEAEQKQLMAIFERLSQDRSGVVEFAREATGIVRDLMRGAASVEQDKRLVHTLKGNCALFGLTTLSTLCHEIENALVADERALTQEERTQIRAAWSVIERRLSRFLDLGEHTMHVRRVDYDAALRALNREGHAVAQELELWKLEALESRFRRVGEQAEALADRLGKGPVQVLFEHNGIRTESERWAPFWTAFVHALRNAIDHGLESRDERALLGKGMATLRLGGSFVGDCFVLELADDGRGIAWDKVRDKARAAGMPADTHDDLVRALLSDGISTKDSVDELSGRGVGMAALAAACTDMGGRISVESKSGKGTCWRFEFPASVAKLPRERRASVVASVYPPN